MLLGGNFHRGGGSGAPEVTGPDRRGTSSGRWQLDQSAFAALLAALHPDPAVAAREYERLRRRLVRFFALHGIQRAAEAADEAFNRLAKRLSGGEVIHKLEPYLAGIARLVALEERQSLQRERQALLDLTVEDPPPGEEERMLAALEHCVRELPEGSGELLRRYYGGAGSARTREREAMARELGLSANSLRNRILRLRQKLERSVRERLERDEPRDDRPPRPTSGKSGG
jgi:DNA-directed RNA polymerase specialized sigma24 family protein